MTDRGVLKISDRTRNPPLSLIHARNRHLSIGGYRVQKNLCRCGAELPKQSGRGRRRSYCCVACRRAAGFAIRNVTRRIATLERLASGMRISLAQGDNVSWWGWGSTKQALPELEKEILLLQARLLKLLKGDKMTEIGDLVAPQERTTVKRN